MIAASEEHKTTGPISYYCFFVLCQTNLIRSLAIIEIFSKLTNERWKKFGPSSGEKNILNYWNFSVRLEGPTATKAHDTRNK